MKSYLNVLATPGAWRFLLPALVARLPFAMLQLGILLLVEWATGSYGAAGVASAAAAVSQAIVGPRTGRLADRHGQARLLVPQLVLHGLALGALLALATAQAPTPLLVVTAALAGASVPQVGAMVRARWAHRLGGTARLNTAFAVESITDELMFTLAPVLLVLLSTGYSPVVALLVALVLVVVGTAVFAGVRTGRPEPMPVRAGSAGGVLRLPGVTPLATAFLAMGSVFGSLQVGVTSLTAGLGAPASAGAIYGTFSGASVLGGLLYGAIRWRVSATARLAAGLALLAAATSTLTVAGTIPLLYGTAALAGLIIAPVVITGYTIIDGLVPDEVRTESFTWLGGAIGLGIATGASVAGQLVDRFGPSLAFVVPPLLTGLAALLVLARRRSLRAAPRAVTNAPEPAPLPG
ncbi:MFS transporter [Nonomuraea cavernae]|uniref:MFS transporter n=1 Tax=Nonomuraea cavernae TaxID=2045107 RepID=A0A917Z097_9ACTN|nr:MFS transporter [Nonomuraea cavernae]MCA2190516.1 MFS transporter [Nonomuraea cavernae]GGO70493.1 MFS transporter [Nonomuraea cavernae]